MIETKSHAVPTRMVPRSRGVVAVAFVAAAVIALAVVPVILGQRAARAQMEIAEVLDPARLLGTRLSLVQARQMSYFQAYLLTGDFSFSLPYEAAYQEERDITAQLQSIVQGMDLEIRERLARLSTVSVRWHVGHQAAFDSEEVRVAMVQNFQAERDLYEELQRATLGLERAIQSEVEAGRRAAEGIRTLQTRVAFVLLLLALLATVGVGAVGQRLRTLTAEADARRRDAVHARREMDALLEATGDGVMGIDLRGRVLSLNRAGSELLGFTEGELRGRDVHDTLHHTAPDGVPRPRESSPFGPGVGTANTARSRDDDVLWRKDGTALPVRWSLRPLVDGGEIRGGVLTFTDMTEIKAKEDALRRAVRVREEVVSVVSHDLRNPLGVVAGAAELLLDLPLEEEERRNQAEVIRRSAERMGRLVDNLLDIARIEAGALVVRPVALKPAEILSETESFFAPQARKAGIELRTEVQDGTPSVLVDPDRIQQALANLVGNALKFTPRGG
ncbi:MAG TPA: histidine kinase dimerization/phospho-acceptor domain-containing protein, partial [Longimicrobiales bacterium]|nr:histidine kinase dimerization/phospho-acceptor domain-containing protein [Longimicrobiales bacterium]